MKKMNLGIQLWSVHDVCLNEGIGKTAENLKKMGYDGVEFALGDDATIEERYGEKTKDVKKALAKNNVKPIGSHIPFDKLITNPDNVLKDCINLELPYAAIGPAFYGDRTPHEKQKELYKKVKEASRILKKNGIQMQVHCSAFGYLKDYQGRYVIDGMIEEAGQEYLQPEFDTAWMICGGVSPEEYLEKYKNFVDILHFKDFHPPITDTEYILVRHNTVVEHNTGCAIGDNGIQDISKIINSAKKNGTKWVITELWNESESMKNAQISAENLRKYI